MGEFTPSRLALARRRRGLTKKRLAEIVKVSVRSLTDYESGLREPSPTTLARLADALHFPLGFFGQPHVEEPPLYGASFRALSKMTATKQAQVQSAAALALELASWIDERFHLPEPDVPQYQGVSPDVAAEAVRSEWGLGAAAIPNMVHLLEAHGVRVFSLAEESRDVGAYSFWLHGFPYLFLNTVKSGEHSRMDAAHELGHLVMHWHHDTPRGREEEKEANAFGGGFLMPKSSVLAEAPRSADIHRLIAAKQRWKVALSNLVYRMHTLELLTEWEYKSAFVELSSKGYRTNEPNGIPRETSQVLGKVFQALRSEGTAMTDIARELQIPVDELSKLVFGLVLTPVGGEGDRGPGTRPELRVVANPSSSSETEPPA